MRKLTAEGFLVIRKRRQWSKHSLIIDRVTANMPSLESGDVAVKVKLSVAAALFEEMVPTVNIELTEGTLILPEVQAEVEVQEE